MLFQNINLWAVLLGAFTNVAFGSLWYSPLIFGKGWMDEKGLTEADFRKGHPIWSIMLLSFLFSLVAAFAMACFIGPQSDALSGAGMGALVSIVWVSVSKANDALFENTSVKLFLIHAGYDVLGYTAMGAILGAWH